MGLPYGPRKMRLTYNWLKEHVELTMSPEALAALLPTIGFGVEKVEPLPGGDTRFDLEVTANRPDCLGIVGIAREIAARTGAKLLCPKSRLQLCGGKTSYGVDTSGDRGDRDISAPGTTPTSLKDVKTGFVLTIEEPRLCTRYVARLLTNVAVKPSPPWLRERIEGIGLRPVNNVVDVTNYVLYETGHPLHAFDYDTLKGNTIRVRLAKKGERIRAIDQRDYELDERTLVIADSAGPVAIAGIMGGANTEVSDRTQSILLEAACFHGPSIRRSVRVLGLPSDSSYRFERQVDAEGVEDASAYAAELIRSVAGGKISELHLDCYPVPQERKRVAMRFSRAKALLGCEVDREDVLRRLAVLGFVAVTDGTSSSRSASSPATAVLKGEQPDRVEFMVPSYRVDVAREEDMVEEVARVLGYDSIPDVPRMNVTLVRCRPEQRVEEVTRKALCAAGFTEVLSQSFMEGEVSAGGPAPFTVEYQEFKGNCRAVGILGRDGNVERYLRTSLRPAFLQIVEGNAAYGITELKLFEIAKRYFIAGGEATQRPSLGILMAQRLSRAEDEISTFLQLKGAFEYLLGTLQIERGRIEFKGIAPALPAEGWSATIELDGRVIGDATSWRHPLRGGGSQLIWMLEVDFEKLCAAAKPGAAYRPLFRLPAVVRDLACIFSSETPWRQIEATVRKAAPPFLVDVVFFDEYRGKSIPEGKKSIAFSLVFRATDRTLTSNEVNASIDAIVRALEVELGAILRGKV